MKKQKKQNLLTMVIILLVIALIMMIGSIVYEEKINMAKQPTQNPEVLLPKEDSEDNKEDNQDPKNDENEHPDEVDQTDETEKEPEFVGEEENNTNEDTSQSKDEKAINLVKKEYGNDDAVTYSIEQKNGIKYYVAVKGSDTETIWYEVDTETWEVSEY